MCGTRFIHYVSKMCIIDPRDVDGRVSQYLSRAGDTQRCQQGIAAISSVRGEKALDEGHDVGAMKDIQLGGIFLKHLSEGELLNGTSSIVGGIQRDVSRRRRSSIVVRRLDGNETIGTWRTGSWWAQAKVDLE